MSILKKFRTLFTMDWAWAYRFGKKRLIHRFSFWSSLFVGRRYWSVNIGGYEFKLAFFTPYHHQIAYSFHLAGREEKVLHVWIEECKNKKVIYDGGAYNGAFALLAARVNPEAKIYIFEPDSVNAKHCRANVKLNAFDGRCTVLEMALSDQSGSVLFASDGTTGAAIRRGGGLSRFSARA